ncbi:MAG: radical SAM protein [Deltaproteobacteria bacterium]|nr:radical SAM protein [Deltaproteobacteria bacterium]
MINIGLLKLDLFLQGVQPISGWAEDFSLVLPENTWVAVSQNSSSPYKIEKQHNGYELVFETGRIAVKPMLPPKAYHKKTTSGHLVGQILHSHGGFIAAAPQGPCRFAKSGLACKYCNTKQAPVSHQYSVDDFIEALRLLLEESPAEILHLSSGFVQDADGGMASLEPLVRQVRKHFNILISVDVMPPASNEWIDKTYAAGVDMLYYDLDVFSPELFAETYPEKDQSIRQQRYLQALEYAVKIFPKGAVTSHLVLGLEPVESTLKGIDVLTDLGVVPLVTFFPPQHGSDLEKKWKPHLKEIVPVYAYLYEKITEKKLSTNWVRQIDVVLTPLEGRHFAGGKSRWQVAVKNFYHTAVGRKAAVGLSAIRRKLRVKEVKGD